MKALDVAWIAFCVVAVSAAVHYLSKRPFWEALELMAFSVIGALLVCAGARLGAWLGRRSR